jgi:hypothetical protein
MVHIVIYGLSMPLRALNPNACMATQVKPAYDKAVRQLLELFHGDGEAHQDNGR